MFVNETLSHPQRVVQSCHACIEASRHFIPPGDNTHNLVVIGIKGESRLQEARLKLDQLGVRHRPFYEPDLGDQLTAIATEPLPEDAPVRRALRRYQLLKA